MGRPEPWLGRWTTWGLTLLLLSACEREPACPSGLHEDPARAQALRELLEGLPELSALLSTPGPQVCFGHSEAGVLGEDGVMRLSGEVELRAEAARAAHLLLHHLEGPPLAPADGRACEVRVAEAMEVEEAAYALEARVRTQLGVPGPAPTPGPELAADYQRRCSP